ncbi:transglycosylase SLT domain-containing protein [Avibacterium paragallinarum]|uniref:transglycosylase SLT domain-containing protein n=1 Tax=Avibacterium paragallinarum TaxID=728 RepID=UPI00397BDD4E
MKFTQTLLLFSLSSLPLFAGADSLTPTNEKAENPVVSTAAQAPNTLPDPNADALRDQQKLTTQREIYRKLQQYLALSQSEATLNIADGLLAQLQDYPLLPYAEYQRLKAQKASLSMAEISLFQQKYPDFPLKDLPLIWLQQQYSVQNWAGILAAENAIKSITANQTANCIILTAQQASDTIAESRDPAASLLQQNTQPEKTREKSTALSSSLKDLWLTGNVLPQQCEALFTQMAQKNLLNKALIKQRALLAVEKNNVALLSQLAKMPQSSELNIWLNNLLNLLKSPQQLRSPASPFYVENLAVNEENKRILLAVMPRFIKGIAENSLDPHAPFAQLKQWAERFNLSPQQKQAWQSALLSQLFDSENPAIQQWRDESVLALKEDKQTERRIRVALREKAEIQSWLNVLSEQAKNKDEWRYWQAAAFLQQGNKPQAEQIWQQMQQNARGFYPMLAAQALNLNYQPVMKTLGTAENVQKYATQLARIQELQALKDNTALQREWRALLDKASFAEKLALAHYAEQNQWADLQVEATIQAKAWDYIALRLPNAYQRWFDVFLNEKTHAKIHRTFAMAIARQESAWRAEVTSSANAKGLMQLLPSTAKLTAEQANLPYRKESQLFDPIDNIMLGTTHLNQLAEKYGNNRILIAAAYNAGAKRVDSWLAKANGKLTMAEFIATIPFYETRGYVQNVLAYDYYYQLLQGETPEKFTQEEKNRLY